MPINPETNERERNLRELGNILGREEPGGTPEAQRINDLRASCSTVSNALASGSNAIRRQLAFLLGTVEGVRDSSSEHADVKAWAERLQTAMQNVLDQTPTEETPATEGDQTDDSTTDDSENTDGDNQDPDTPEKPQKRGVWSVIASPFRALFLGKGSKLNPLSWPARTVKGTASLVSSKFEKFLAWGKRPAKTFG